MTMITILRAPVAGTITTTAASDEESFALLEAFGMPFSKEGRAPAARAVAEPAVTQA